MYYAYDKEYHKARLYKQFWQLMFIIKTFNASPLDKMAAILADDTSKCIFWMELSIENSVKFVTKGPNNNIPALV